MARCYHLRPLRSDLRSVLTSYGTILARTLRNWMQRSPLFCQSVTRARAREKPRSSQGRAIICTRRRNWTTVCTRKLLEKGRKMNTGGWSTLEGEIKESVQAVSMIAYAQEMTLETAKGTYPSHLSLCYCYMILFRLIRVPTIIIASNLWETIDKTHVPFEYLHPDDEYIFHCSYRRKKKQQSTQHSKSKKLLTTSHDEAKDLERSIHCECWLPTNLRRKNYASNPHRRYTEETSAKKGSRWQDRGRWRTSHN